MNFHRILDIDLPSGQSAFLWGARKTGKTTFLKNKFPDSLCIDFLKTDTFLEYLKAPSLLRESILAKDESRLRQPIILDEVQKVPHLLDEVQWLIENRGAVIRPVRLQRQKTETRTRQSAGREGLALPDGPLDLCRDR